MNQNKYIHIVDGDASVAALKKAELQGSFINWLDVLHDGPVQGSLPLQERIKQRATFIQSMGWSSQEEAFHRLIQRFQQLEKHADHEWILWLSPELFDQLHLWELSDWLAETTNLSKPLYRVDLPNSLPMVSREDLQHCFQQRKPFTPAQLQLAHRAWRAFSGTDPRQLENLLNEEGEELPHFTSSLKRLIQMYPGPDGLSLSQRHTLNFLEEGPKSAIDCFKHVRTQEEIPFMGDSSYWWRLEALCEGAVPLVTRADAPTSASDGKNHLLQLTTEGHRVLHKQATWSPAPFWIGGVDLGQVPWRYEKNFHTASP